jgi:hypothetical protein
VTVTQFPTPKVSPDEQARRLKNEVQRLSRLPLVEREFYANREDHAQQFNVTPAQLLKLVKAVVKEKEKKEREAKAEDQRREDRAKKERAAAQRREEKRELKDRERAEKEAKKEAGRKQRKREKQFAILLKLPSSEHEPRLVGLAKCLDEDIDCLRDEFAQYAAIEQPITSADTDFIEPWSEPVKTEALLTDVLAQFRRYVIVHDDAGELAIILWIFFAWAHADVAVHSPLLVLNSAEGDTGKTTAAGVIKFLTPRAYSGAELTGPTLYRFVDHVRPTLIIDDADRLLIRRPDLVHIINVSWTRGTKIARQERINGHLITRWFDPFCPKLIAGVNVQLHKTTATRSITIKLWPKLPEEKVEDFDHLDNDEFRTLRRKLARWTADNITVLKEGRPIMPDGINNRAANNWKLLLATADSAGGTWPKLVRQAATKLSRQRHEPSEGKRLLSIFYDLFAKQSMLTSKRVHELLTADPSSEWADYHGRGRPITVREIALLLDPYDIHPNVIHPDGRKADRGYKVEWFEKAFWHYLGKLLPPKPPTTIRRPGGKSVPRGKSRKVGAYSCMDDGGICP